MHQMLVVNIKMTNSKFNFLSLEIKVAFFWYPIIVSSIHLRHSRIIEFIEWKVIGPAESQIWQAWHCN